MTYCKLSDNEKQRTCSITDKISENSKDCAYNVSKKKCYITKTTKPKPEPVKPVPKPDPVSKPDVSKKTSPVVEIKPHTLHKPVVPVEQQNIQVNNLKTLKNKVEYNKWVKKIHKDKLFNIERKKPIGNNIPVMNKKQITEITSNNVPDDTISLVTYMPYNDDIDYKGVKFYKLGTCSKTCQNKGIFAKNKVARHKSRLSAKIKSLKSA